MDLASDPDSPQANLVLRECGSLIVWESGCRGGVASPKACSLSAESHPYGMYGMYGMVCMVSMHKSIKGEFTPDLDDGLGPLQYSLFRLFSLFSLYNYR